MIKLYVLPEIAVIDQDFGNSFVVSIVSPGREHPKIIGSHVHRFYFHDVTEEYFLENQNRVIRPMEKEIAESIAELAMNNRDCDRWIIHCEAGISRSPAVAIGLSKYLKFNPNRRNLKKMFPLYNKHVCQLIEEAMEKKLKEIDKILGTPGCIGEG